MHWEEGISNEDLLARIALAKSTLMGWFDYNAAHPTGTNRNLLYREFPRYHVWRNKRWETRKEGRVIARMYVAFPSQGGVYYIRLLLTERRGVVSFEALRTVDGQLSRTFREACRQLGIIDDDNE